MYKDGQRGWHFELHNQGGSTAVFYLGIDVSKAKLDCSLLLDVNTLRSRSKSVANSREGFAALLEWVQRQTQAGPPELIAALEPTGVYHQVLATALYDAGVTVVVVNPAQLRDFASGLAVRGKTDAKDSLVLARYAAQPQRIAWQPAPLEVRQLQALVSRLDAVEAELQRELNRQHAAELEPPRDSRRLHFLRGWSHENNNEIFAGVP